MPKVTKIIVGAEYIGVGGESSVNIINATNPSDIEGFDFSSETNIPSAKSLQTLKRYVDSAVIPEEAITFDTTPVQGSNKPVTSDGIYSFVSQAINAFFRNKFIVLTQEEYDAIEVKDDSKFYMIIEEDEIIDENDS